MRKVFALITALVMVFALAAFAYAANENAGPSQQPPQPTYSTGGSGSGSDSTTAETPKNETLENGTEAQVTGKTQEYPDGTTVDQKTTESKTDKVEENTTTDKNGNTETTTDYTVKDATGATNGTYSASVPVKAATSTGSAAKVNVSLPSGSNVSKIEIPVSNLTDSTVVVLVDKDGNETIVKDAVKTENGVLIPTNGMENFTVKIVNNDKTVADAADVATYFADEVKQAVAREIIVGDQNGNIMPKDTLSYERIATMTARVAGMSLAETTGANWADKPIQWAKETAGVAKENKDAVTIAETAELIYAAFGKPAVTGNLDKFTDAASVPEVYKNAVIWCVENNILIGNDNSALNVDRTLDVETGAAMIMRAYRAK